MGARGGSAAEGTLRTVGWIRRSGATGLRLGAAVLAGDKAPAESLRFSSSLRAWYSSQRDFFSSLARLCTVLKFSRAWSRCTGLSATHSFMRACMTCCSEAESLSNCWAMVSHLLRWGSVSSPHWAASGAREDFSWALSCFQLPPPCDLAAPSVPG